MKELVIISGKGGTGKTSLTGSLSVLAWNKVMADCDVDASNLHLLLKPSIKIKNPFYAIKKAHIQKDSCNNCGQCHEICNFGAIKLLNENYYVDELSCEGCGVCKIACPSGSIAMEDHISGYLMVSDTLLGPLVHARLGIGEEGSGKLVAAVRKEAKRIAEEEGHELIITDGPPGIGCPVISCLPEASLVLVVTEPTNPGIHDLNRVLNLVDHFNGKAGVCINKWDLSEENTSYIEQNCISRNVPVIGKIPYDQAISELLREGKSYINKEGPAQKATLEIWDRLEKMLY